MQTSLKTISTGDPIVNSYGAGSVYSLEELRSNCEEFARQHGVAAELVLQAGYRALSLRRQGLLGEAPSWTLRTLLTAPNAPKADLEPNGVSQLDEPYCRLLAALMTNPDMPISAPCYLSEEAWQRQVHEWNDTRTEYPRNSTIIELFEQAAQENAERIAVVEGGQTLAYAALNERA